MNLFPEPLAMREIIDAGFPDAPVGPAREPAPRYGIRSRHAAAFGGAAGWRLDGTRVLGEIARYAAAERRRMLDAERRGMPGADWPGMRDGEGRGA